MPKAAQPGRDAVMIRCRPKSKGCALNLGKRSPEATCREHILPGLPEHPAEWYTPNAHKEQVTDPTVTVPQFFPECQPPC